MNHDERLLEWAFTFEQYRGLGIMACAMAQIAERGTLTGARWVLTLVEKNNIASLKGCRSAGFRPHQVRQEMAFAAPEAKGTSPCRTTRRIRSRRPR